MMVLARIAKAESVEEVIGLAVGAGSTCWENMSGTGVFQSDEAGRVVGAACRRIAELTGQRAAREGT